MLDRQMEGQMFRQMFRQMFGLRSIRLYLQARKLEEEKQKLERKMSAKNEEIVSLTYNHENNKMRIR